MDEHFPDHEHPIRAGGDKWQCCNPVVYAYVATYFLSQRKNKVKQTHEPTQQEPVVKSCHEAGFSKTVDVGQFLRTTFQQSVFSKSDGHDEPIFENEEISRNFHQMLSELFLLEQAGYVAHRDWQSS